MATIIVYNASTSLQTNSAQFQSYLNQGAMYDGAADTLYWPDGHANDTTGGATGSPGGIAGGASGTGVDLVPGATLTFERDRLLREHELELQRQEAAAIQAQDEANNQFTAQQNELNRTFQEHMAEQDRELQLALDERRITSNEYMQARDLAQQESQYARTLALQTITAERDNALQQAQLELQKVAEARAERDLQANLAANPADFVRSQFYQRGLVDPAAGAGVTDGDMELAAQMVDSRSTLSGTPYPAAAPAYDDATLQTLAAELFSGNTGAPYNPNLAGTGAFGVNIQAPNTISRQQGMSLSDQDMGLLSSFLKAGVDVGGSRVAIDPAQYFKQVEDSWIPTLASATPGTRYA